MSASRQQILDHIRAATAAVARPAEELAQACDAIPRPYLHAGLLDREACVQLMIERLRDYDAEVVECTPGELAATIAAQLGASGRRRLVAPEGLPEAWLATGFDWRIDCGLSASEVNEADGVVTAAFCGVADSGTIVLHHSPQEGRRVLTLLPDWHLCVLRASQVVETLPEYFARCPEPPHLHRVDKDPSPGAPRLVTWISGPSATADIEMMRIKGVHGPRFLQVILVRDET